MGPTATNVFCLDSETHHGRHGCSLRAITRLALRWYARWTKPVHVLNSFFVVAPARRCGLGLQFASTVVAANPGRWAVAFQDANIAAAQFWPKLAAEFAPTGHWNTDRFPADLTCQPTPGSLSLLIGHPEHEAAPPPAREV